MIWWWVASAVVTTVVAKLATDDSSNDYDKNKQEEKRKSNEQTSNLARRQEEERKLFVAQNLAITFLSNNFNIYEPFSDSIRLQKTIYSLKLKIGEIISKYPHKDIEVLTTELKEKQAKLNRIENALYDLKQLMDSINE